LSCKCVDKWIKGRVEEAHPSSLHLQAGDDENPFASWWTNMVNEMMA
jgi:hypothetical protein